ncbi:MAG: hypothetical protein CUN57_02175, partial [Phototrophicales bacterium]
QAVTTRADTTSGKNEETTDDTTDEKDDLKEVVFVYDEGVARMKEVKTGIQDNRYIAILDGITESDEVITGPYRAISKKLKDGDAVKKVDKKELFEEND